jgi:hypothetical protein
MQMHDPVQMARLWAVSLGGGGLEMALEADELRGDLMYVDTGDSPASSPAVSRISSADGVSAAPTAQASPTMSENILASSPASSPASCTSSLPSPSAYLSGGAGAGMRGSRCKTRVGADEPTWGLNEAVERMRGFQERYTTSIQTAAGSGQLAKVLEVTEGTEHLELFKSHGSAHGADHVKFVGKERPATYMPVSLSVSPSVSLSLPQLRVCSQVELLWKRTPCCIGACVALR